MSAKKDLYHKKILRQLYFTNSLSCLDISEKIKKSIPFTTALLNTLVKDGKVQETGHAPSTGGRRPQMYSMDPDIIHVLSVAMDQYVTRMAIMNMQNEFVTPIHRIQLPLAGNAEATKILANEINSFISNAGIDKKKIAGVGIGMPGFVDVDKGVNYTFLHTEKKSLVSYLKEVTGLHITIDNDSSLMALAEYRFGAARNRKNAMVINIGWGIGLGMILNGCLFRGHNGFAGEFSHIPMFTNGKMCECGKTGCLETETSLVVVADKARQGLKEGRVSFLKSIPENYLEATEAIIAAATRGDRFAIELLSEAGYNIGRGAAILIHILNPEIIVLTGRGALVGKIWKTPIQQALNEHCIPRLADNTEIEVSELGHNAELIGAAALVMENYERP